MLASPIQSALFDAGGLSTPPMPALPSDLGSSRLITRSVGGGKPSDRSFGMTLGSALRKADSPQDAQRAAEEFVSIAFIQPILKSLRESNDAAPPFAPTAAEKSFGPLLDAELAQRIVAHERYGLVDAVARQLLHKGQPATSTTAPIDTHA